MKKAKGKEIRGITGSEQRGREKERGGEKGEGKRGKKGQEAAKAEQERRLKASAG